jgi:hypothetical protein
MMELNIKFDKKMLVEMANHVLDGYEYNGKTIREWADLIANPKTNADRVRAMTDEELANKISGLESFALTCGGGWPPEKWLDWLKQEAEGNAQS